MCRQARQSKEERRARAPAGKNPGRREAGEVAGTPEIVKHIIRYGHWAQLIALFVKVHDLWFDNIYSTLYVAIFPLSSILAVFGCLSLESLHPSKSH